MEMKDMTDYKQLIEEYYSATISEQHLAMLRKAVEDDPEGDAEFDVLRRIFALEKEGQENLALLAPADLDDKIMGRIHEMAVKKKGAPVRKRFSIFAAIASAAAVIAILFGLGVRLNLTDDKKQTDMFAQGAPVKEVVAVEEDSPVVDDNQEASPLQMVSAVAPSVKNRSATRKAKRESQNPAVAVGEEHPLDPKELEESYALLNECFSLLGEAISDARGEYSESLSEINYEQAIKQL